MLTQSVACRVASFSQNGKKNDHAQSISTTFPTVKLVQVFTLLAVPRTLRVASTTGHVWKFYAEYIISAYRMSYTGVQSSFVGELFSSSVVGMYGVYIYIYIYIYI